MINFSLLLTSLTHIAEPITKWLTIGLTCVALLAIIILAIKKMYKPIKRIALCFVIYALIVALVMLTLNLLDTFNEQYFEENGLNPMVATHVFIPLLVTCALALLGATLLLIINKTYPEKLKAASKIFAICIAVCAIVTLVLIATYYARVIADDGYFNSDKATVNQVALYILSASLIILLIVGSLILGRKDKTLLDSHSIALAGITIALSFALSYVRLFKMPQGGSITFISLLPIMLYSYIYGVKNGVIVGVAYGLLQAVQDAWIIHPAQMLLDYPVAFAMIGFVGVFKNFKAIKHEQIKFLLGAGLVALLRFVSHFISGIFAFEAYAGDTNPVIYSMAYNSFVFVDMALVVVASVFALSSNTLVKQMNTFAK